MLAGRKREIPWNEEAERERDWFVGGKKGNESKRVLKESEEEKNGLRDH